MSNAPLTKQSKDAPTSCMNKAIDNLSQSLGNFSFDSFQMEMKEIELSATALSYLKLVAHWLQWNVNTLPNAQDSMTGWLMGDFHLYLGCANRLHGTAIAFHPQLLACIWMQIEGLFGLSEDKMYTEAKHGMKYKEFTRTPGCSELFWLLCRPRHSAEPCSPGTAKKGMRWKASLGTGPCRLHGRLPSSSAIRDVVRPWIIVLSQPLSSGLGKRGWACR